MVARADAEPRVVVADAPADDRGQVARPRRHRAHPLHLGHYGSAPGVELTGRNLGCAPAELHFDLELDTSSVWAAPIPFFHEQPADLTGILHMLVDRKVIYAALVPTVLLAATEVIGCSFLLSYGLTESTGGFCLLGVGDHVPEEKYEHRLRSAGRPMAGSPVRVVDPATLEDCPVGQRGEVLVSGGQVMKGYWRKPQQTAEVMLPGGWLRTGDGGSFDEDGYLYLHDRLKDLIVTGGENAHPAEVESVMTDHPDVAEVAVVGVRSAEWGESPYAVVILRPGAALSEADLIAWTQDRLAHFKCPAGVTFTDALARIASGKLRKQVIRAGLGPVAVP